MSSSHQLPKCNNRLYTVLTIGHENQNYSLRKLAKNMNKWFPEEKILMVKNNMATCTNLQIGKKKNFVSIPMSFYTNQNGKSLKGYYYYWNNK